MNNTGIMVYNIIYHNMLKVAEQVMSARKFAMAKKNKTDTLQIHVQTLKY